MPTSHKKNARVRAKETLNEKILRRYQRLPLNQKKIADYFLNQRPNDFNFLSTDAMAEALAVSKATVVRFAQRLGYEGFTELRSEVLETLQTTLAPADRVMLALAQHTPEEALTLVAEHEVRNINETLQRLERKRFNEVVQMLVAAERIYTLGLGISSLLAEVLAYGLNQVARDARALSSTRMRFMEHLIPARKTDLVVCFSFPPYSKETLVAATYAQERGLPVIAITDKLTSPITFHADQVLAVRTKNMLYTNSISAISVVINALVTEIALLNKSAAEKVFKESSRVLQQAGEYVAEHGA